jgi:hypothetical protein
MICKDAKNQQAKKTIKWKKEPQKLKLKKKESEYDIKKMPNHVNFDKIHLCLLFNVIVTLTPS